VKATIRKYINPDHKNWDVLLPKVVLSLNINVHESTGYSPFFLAHGRNPILPMDLQCPTLSKNDSMNPEEKELLSHIARQNARRKIIRAQRNRTRVHARKHKPHTFKLDDLVIWKTPASMRLGPTTKFGLEWLGPYEITKFLKNGAVMLKHTTNPNEIKHATPDQLKRLYIETPQEESEQSLDDKNPKYYVSSCDSGKDEWESWTPPAKNENATLQSIDPNDFLQTFTDSDESRPSTSGIPSFPYRPIDPVDSDDESTTSEFDQSPDDNNASPIQLPTHQYNLRPRANLNNASK
jgi:hypothetical protein